MNDQQLLAAYVDAWKGACDDFVALARTLTEAELRMPTDLEGWNVFDNVAHVAHLEHVLATGDEETVKIDPGPHAKGLTGWYTEQGVVARRGRAFPPLVDELEADVASRHRALLADPPTDGAAPAPRTPGGVGWNNETLLGNRALDVWMHGQDIRRAIGRPGGFDIPAAMHTIRRLGAGVPMVLGKRVAPPAGTSVRIEIPDAVVRLAATIGDDGRARREPVANPTAVITLSAEAFIVLAGGRRTPDQVEFGVVGDEVLANELLANLALTP